MAKNVTMWYEQGNIKHNTTKILPKKKLSKIFEPGIVKLVKVYTRRRTTQGRKRKTKEHTVRKSKRIYLY